MAAKSDLPDFSDYFAPAVAALKKRGGSATIEELEEDVSRLMNISDDVLAVPHKDGTRSQFQYELAWVRTYLKKAGLADNSERGVWTLTDAGEKISPVELKLVPKKVRWAKKQTSQTKGDELPLGVEEADPDWQARTLAVIAAPAMNLLMRARWIVRVLELPLWSTGRPISSSATT